MMARVMAVRIVFAVLGGVLAVITAVSVVRTRHSPLGRRESFSVRDQPAPSVWTSSAVVRQRSSVSSV